jgi:hypothetical protein
VSDESTVGWTGYDGNGGVLIKRIETVESVDADIARTRIYLGKSKDVYWTDILTCRGFVPIAPGTRLRVTVEFMDKEGES